MVFDLFVANIYMQLGRALGQPEYGGRLHLQFGPLSRYQRLRYYHCILDWCQPSLVILYIAKYLTCLRTWYLDLTICHLHPGSQRVSFTRDILTALAY